MFSLDKCDSIRKKNAILILLHKGKNKLVLLTLNTINSSPIFIDLGKLLANWDRSAWKFVTGLRNHRISVFRYLWDRFFTFLGIFVFEWCFSYFVRYRYFWRFRNLRHWNLFFWLGGQPNHLWISQNAFSGHNLLII